MRVVAAIIVSAACVLLTGCPQPIVKPQAVYISKPVWFCPAPPELGSIDLLTAQLTSTDASDPGKVATYYKADMLMLVHALRARDEIINQYRVSNLQANELQKRVDELYLESLRKLSTAPASP